MPPARRRERGETERRRLEGRVEPAQRRQGRRPTAQSERTRHKVIQAAAVCIAEEGLAAAHTNRIAERAGVSWGVLQYHFGDKAGLLGAVLERGFEELERGFREVEVGGGTLRARLSAVVDAGWQIFRSPLARAGNEILVHTRAESLDDPDRARLLEAMTRDLAQLARGALRKAIGDARLARQLEGTFLSALRGFSLALMMTPSNYDFARERRALVEMLARYVEA
ncbi:MAG: TetR family transcriptional regulator [bacterium]|nr:TetR family transcriptional regulator [bacterium]MCP5070564.1 TetR family transcriptional regulator [bacterium]